MTPVDALIAVIHAECEAEWDRLAKAGALAISMHDAEAHRRLAERRIAALEALGWRLVHRAEVIQ